MLAVAIKFSDGTYYAGCNKNNSRTILGAQLYKSEKAARSVMERSINFPRCSKDEVGIVTVVLQEISTGLTGTVIIDEFINTAKGGNMTRKEAIKNDLGVDCISREQAIEWVDNLRKMDECFGNHKGDYYPLSEVIDRLQNVPSVTPQEPGWIPIKTRPLTKAEELDMLENSDYYAAFTYACQLPEDEEEVLITTRGGNVTTTTFFNEGLDGCYFECYEDDGDVIAWMPKPTPYVAEEEDNNENQ